MVVALGPHLDVEVTRIRCGAADGVVQIEFVFSAFTGKAAQATQCHFDVARTEFNSVVIVLVGALLPHFDGAFVSTLAANTDALRVVAAVAKR